MCPGASASGHTVTRRNEQITRVTQHWARSEVWSVCSALTTGHIKISFHKPQYYSKSSSAGSCSTCTVTNPSCVRISGVDRNRECTKTPFKPHFLFPLHRSIKLTKQRSCVYFLCSLMIKNRKLGFLWHHTGSWRSSRGN